MNNKTIIISLVILAILVSAFFLTRPGPTGNAVNIEDSIEPAQAQEIVEGSSVPIDSTKSSFTFVGYALGGAKSHSGGFANLQADLIKDESGIIGFNAVVQADSVSTGIEGLDNHLKADDFFDVASFPTIEFTTLSLDSGVLRGNLNFHGVEKTISFPVETSGSSISADFVLDTTDFGMTNSKVSKEVEISFVFSK